MRVYQILLILLLVFAVPMVQAEINPGPETINLKEKYSIQGKKKPVIFDHKAHQQKLECIKCHTDEKGSKLLFEINKIDTISNDFHRAVCWQCHKTMKVAIGKDCNACHK
ncbi:MAG: cytochrome c family protein [Proteobacteria bacterium]|nr:cytochrome c family protein [Pseudomonadota bacterium]MBU1709282.1 cytochrome c family protein [Pseudomonadota bacterium]